MFGFASKRALIFLASLLGFVALVIFGNSITPTSPSGLRGAGPSLTILPNEVTRDPLPDPSTLIGDPVTPIITPETTAIPRPNLTNAIASMIGKSIALKNPEGPKEGVLTVEETEEIANSALTASLDTSIISRLTPPDSDIIVLIDISADELSYRAAADRAIGETAGSFIPDTGASISAQMAAFSEMYGQMARKLANVPVPARLADLHRNQIRSAIIRQRAFAAVAEYETDPVYALLAIKTIKETK